MRNRMLLLVAAAMLIVAAPAMAFHDGGVAHCNGCHTMHNSQNGEAMNFASDGTPGGTAVGIGHASLLLFANKTDVCLNCHAGSEGSYHVWTDNVIPTTGASANRGGGDFVFLEEDNINDAHAGASNPILGHAAGHSVISDMKGTVVDPENATSPGGTYPATAMHCTSCHDPHGTDAYRLTYKSGQSVTTDDGTGSSSDFTTNWSATISAVGKSLFSGAESNASHNAYQSGYAAWCATCHGDFHASSADLVHPAGELMSDWTVLVYNKYRGTTDCVANPPSAGLPCGSGSGTSYLHLVPFEDTANSTTGFSGNANAATSYVSCVSCHRAHATSAPDAGRWDFNVTGLAEDGPESGSYRIPVNGTDEAQSNYYDPYQRSLCNKCHGKDEFDQLRSFAP